MMNLSRHITRKRGPSHSSYQIVLRSILWILLGHLGIQATPAQDILIPAGASEWFYWDEGPLVDSSWRDSDFDDSTWPTGTAPLGYGDGDEATVLNYGPDAGNKLITSYFRHGFEVADPAQYAALRFRLQRDDGAVVYLNGAEIFRDNMPAGELSFNTRAISTIGGGDEKAYQLHILESPALVTGRNVVVVEVHQASPNSSDISFDLELSGEWFPLEISLMYPENLTTVDPPSTELTVAVLDPNSTSPTSSLSATYYAREAGPAPGPDFCLIALPDTQYYTSTKNGGTPEIFLKQIEWIQNQQASRNIVFVTHLGDCVENGDHGGDDTEWRNATNALYRLETYFTPTLSNGIPYGFAPGNHDLSVESNGATRSVFFNQYFGVDHFQGRPYYGGHHGTNNNNNFELFSASGLEFIIVHLEYNTTPEPALLAWADQLLKTHAQRRAIIVCHYLMGNGQQAPFGQQGQAIYDALKNNPNLFLMLAGHIIGEGQRQDTWEDRTVHTLMANYQGRSRGGDGWLRILEFSPSNHVVNVRTYTPFLDQYETDADSEFTLDYDMRRGDPFRMVGQITNLNSGTQASLTWTNLLPSTPYEWYVEVTDGTRTRLSPVGCFTTSEIQPPEPARIEVKALDPIASEVGPCLGRFAVQRAGSTNLALTVLLNLGGSAVRGVDFEEIETEVFLAAGVCWQELVITPREDAIAEGIEEVTLEVIATEYYEVGANASASMLIADRDTDMDGDGMTDGAEVFARTDWTDGDSLLKISTLVILEDRVELSWSGVTGVVYRVCAQQDLNGNAWTDLSEDILGEDGTVYWSEPMTPQVGRRFYRIRVAANFSPQ